MSLVTNITTVIVQIKRHLCPYFTNLLSHYIVSKEVKHNYLCYIRHIIFVIARAPVASLLHQKVIILSISNRNVKLQFLIGLHTYILREHSAR